MKRLWYAVICLTAVTVLCVVEYVYTVRTSDKLTQMLDRSTEYERNGEHKNALEEYSRLIDYWEKSSSQLGLLLEHRDIDDITVLTSSAGEYLRLNMTDDFLVECRRIKSAVKSFTSNETDILRNLF